MSSTAQSQEQGEGGAPASKDERFIEAAALLSHVQMLESRQGSLQHFGHPPPPQIAICRVSDPMKSRDMEIFATIAYTQRCASAQLLKESVDFSSVGAPVEVLVLTTDERITCAALLPLELPELSAQDAVIVPDRSTSFEDEDSNNVISLMTGGVVPMAASQRVCMVFGTNKGRVLSVEFSVKPRSMQLVRRDNTMGDDDLMPYFQPLPHAKLTPMQQDAIKSTQKRQAKQSRRYSLKSAKADAAITAQAHPSISPFVPKGGVTTITPYSAGSEKSKDHAMTFVWMSFGDGHAIRLHHAGFFPSVIQKHNEMLQSNTSMLSDPKSLEAYLSPYQAALLKCRVNVPGISEDSLTVIPLPKSHPSPLAPLVDFSSISMDASRGPATTTRKEPTYLDTYEAAVYCSGYTADAFPTIAFFTSENQCQGRIQGDLDDGPYVPEVTVMKAVFGGAVSLLGGVVGGLMSVATGSNQARQSKQAVPLNDVDDNDNNMKADPVDDRWDPQIPFPSMNSKPVKLYCGFETHDYPRQITNCTVEPDGSLAAISDTLGRVSLIDLATKHVIRMWKGYRDTVCQWIQVPQETTAEPWRRSKLLYLVIHSKQRRVVDVWRTRHGPKVKSIQVGRDAQLVPCKEPLSKGHISICYLAHSNIAFSSRNHLEKIVFDENKNDAIIHRQVPTSSRTRKEAGDSSQDAAVRLQRLQQLLGNMNIVCQSIDVYRALQNITSIKDLSVALDLLAVAPVLEDKMGIEGSTFQKLAVSHCRQKLDETIRGAGDDAHTNPHVQVLAFKIAYFSQIIKAYDILHKFEMDPSTPPSEKDMAPQSSWAIEAVGWASTYDKIHKKPPDASSPNSTIDPLKFFTFANVCDPPKNSLEDQSEDGYKIQFSDSSKTRKDLLIHIFRPLLGDIFAFSVVENIYGALGLRNEFDFLQKCFGEWFVSLSLKEATQRALFIAKSPMSRWLQEMVMKQLADTDKYLENGIVLESLYNFCRKSEDLVRAFYLATLCRDSVSKATKQKEEETYGKISSDELVQSWEQLLRRLRMCLLVSLRLNGMRLGIEPITVQSAERQGNFSVLQWLAFDELKISHDHEEIVSLEIACKISSHGFNPCDPVGDDTSRWKVIQQACLAASISEAERAEYLVDFDDEERLGSLLLYLRPYSQPQMLVAHRALLLAVEWGKNPSNLDLLKAVLTSLKAIPVNQTYKSMAAAVRLAVWQNQIRPIYRALLVGFDDVPEVSAVTVAPLFDQRDWMASFGKLASEMLSLLNDIAWEYGEEPNDSSTLPSVSVNLEEGATGSADNVQFSLDKMEVEADKNKVTTDTWPPIHPDHILKRLIEKSRLLDSSSVDAHRVLICALLVSPDTTSLSESVPAFFDLFTTQAMFQPVTPLNDGAEKQHMFMQDAIVACAKSYNGPTLDTLELEEIDTLASLWKFDKKNVRTLFLLSMYEFGKDRMVDELLTKCSSAISVHHFCKDGIDIICRRLHDVLHIRQHPEIQKVMSMLDADVCEWIKERSEGSEPLVSGNFNVPVQDTHLFALRLLSLAAVAEISKEERIRIHSLIVLSGTLVKAVEENMSEL